MSENLDIAEAAKGGPFVYALDGESRTLPDPAALPFQQVLVALQVETFPDLPRMPAWLAESLFERWSAHYDLPTFQEAQRLTYLVDRYRSALTYDLRQHLGVDLGELWRARRWRTLLDYIDHLPGHTWYAASVASDPEHAKMLAESIANRPAGDGDEADPGPPLQTWTPEVAATYMVTDAIRSLEHTVVMANGGKGEPPAPLSRPNTILDRAIRAAKFAVRQAKHEALAARLLPHKRRK
jgi:hypothetical protein